MSDHQSDIIAKHLRQVREVIQLPDRWFQGSEAVNQFGSATHPDSPTACRWCLTGAIKRVAFLASSDAPYKLIRDMRSAMRKAIGQGSIIDFNDDSKTTHADVLAALHRAIGEQCRKTRGTDE